MQQKNPSLPKLIIECTWCVSNTKDLYCMPSRCIQTRSNATEKNTNLLKCISTKMLRVMYRWCGSILYHLYLPSCYQIQISNDFTYPTIMYGVPTDKKCTGGCVQYCWFFFKKGSYSGSNLRLDPSLSIYRHQENLHTWIKSLTASVFFTLVPGLFLLFSI